MGRQFLAVFLFAFLTVIRAQSYSDSRPISFPTHISTAYCDCMTIQSKLDQQEQRITRMLNLLQNEHSTALNKLEHRVTQLIEQLQNTPSTDSAQQNDRVLGMFDQLQNQTVSVLANHTAKLDQLDHRFFQLLEQLKSKTNPIDIGQTTLEQTSCSVLHNQTDSSLSSQDEEKTEPIMETSTVANSTTSEPFWPIVSGIKVPHVDTQFGSKWITVLESNHNLGFYRTWTDYVNGWGQPNYTYGGYWIGLENLHKLTTNAPHELAVEMTDMKNNKRYARYERFRIGTEDQGYAMLELGRHSGTAGDGLSAHRNYGFSTSTKGNGSSCSKKHGHGGWWFFSGGRCYESCLTGNAGRVTDFGVIWGKFKKEEKRTHLKSAIMMIRAK